LNTKKPALFGGFPVAAKLVIAAAVIFISFMIFLFIGVALALPFFDISGEDILNFSGDGNIGFLKYLQIVQSFGLFIVPAFLIAYLFNRNTGEYLKYNIKPDAGALLKAALLIICAIPLINYTAEINEKLLDYLLTSSNWLKDMENVALRLTEKFLYVDNTSGLILNIFMIAILPAIGEELIFRGVLQKLFIEWTKNIHISIIFAAFIFSAIHFQFYGFLPRFLMGLLFGYLFVWTGNIWIPIVAHFVNNCFAVFISFFIQKESLSKEAETFGADKGTIIYVIVSVLIVGWLLYSIYKKKQRVL
jgi:membrane protease YdiL (CAAX protease family)